MFFINFNQNNLTPQNLRNIVVDLDNESRLNPFDNFFTHILRTIESDPTFLNNNREFSQILFSETFQIIYESIIYHQAKIKINSLGKLYAMFCDHASRSGLIIFQDQMATILSILKEFDQGQLQPFPTFCKTILSYDILARMIKQLPSYKTFSECASTFIIFNELLPFCDPQLLPIYAALFDQSEYSLTDPRFQDPVSISFTKALSLCSPNYYLFHYQNLTNFIKKSNSSEAKKELLLSLKNSAFLQTVYQSFVVDFLFIMKSLVDDRELFDGYSTILRSNMTQNVIADRIGNDLILNLFLVDDIKQFLTKEKVDQIINSREFDNQTVKFGQQVIAYDIQLISDIPQFLKNCFSLKTKNEKDFVDIIDLCKSPDIDSLLLELIKNTKIENQDDFGIVFHVLRRLKPTKELYDYTDFLDESLNYLNSKFLFPFIQNNSFMPFELFDVELLMTFVSPFSEQFSEFLLNNFLNDILLRIDFFIDFELDDLEENKVYGNFLFELYKKMENKNTKLIWNSIHRVRDTNDELHSIAQEIMNSNPEKSQEEIIKELFNRKAADQAYFLNFDYSKFPETLIDNDGLPFLFNHPVVVDDENNIFYLPAKIRKQLNHNEQIDENDVINCYSVEIGSPPFDSIFNEISFDASQLLNIEFLDDPESQYQAIELAFEVNHKSFINKLFKYISEQLISISDAILHCFSKFNVDYALELIEKGNVSDDNLNTFFGYQTEQSRLILQKLKNKVSIEILEKAIFSKDDFINFIKSGRISDDSVFQILFSPKFPQNYRTTRVMKFIFDHFNTNISVLFDFLKGIQGKRKVSYNCIPEIIGVPFPIIHRILATIFPSLSAEFLGECSSFYSNLLYSRTNGEPISHSFPDIMVNELPETLLYQIQYVKILIDFPYKNKDFFYCIESVLPDACRTAHLDYYYSVAHQCKDTSCQSISDFLRTLYFYKLPQILVFTVPDFKISFDKEILINTKKYALRAVSTPEALYIPYKGSKYVKWTNNDKSYVSELPDKLCHLYYQPVECQFDHVFNKLKKFRSAQFTFNLNSVICDSLLKAKIDWSNFTKNDELYELAVLLLSKCGYPCLFDYLIDFPEFAIYFFKSHLTNYEIDDDIKSRLDALIGNYPNKDELISIAKDSFTKNQNPNSCLSIALDLLNLQDKDLINILSESSSNFDYYEKIILKYFMNPDHSNQILQKNHSLAKYVFKLISKEPFDKVRHLFNPMPYDLFTIIVESLDSTLLFTFLSQKQNSTKYILKSISVLEKNDSFVAMYKSMNSADPLVFKESTDWIQPGLLSTNEVIRNRTMQLIKLHFTPQDDLSHQFKDVLYRALHLTYFGSIGKFIISFYGNEFLSKDTEFTVKIFDWLFALPTEPQNMKDISIFLSYLSSLNDKQIDVYSQLLIKLETHPIYYTCGMELFYLAVRSKYFLSPNNGLYRFFHYLSHYRHYDLIKKLLDHLYASLNNSNVKHFLLYLLEIDIFGPFSYAFLTDLYDKLSELRQTELVFILLAIPYKLYTQENQVQLILQSLNMNQEIPLMGFDLTNKVLTDILEKKAFIRSMNDKEYCSKMAILYQHLFLPYIREFPNVLRFFGHNIEVLKKVIVNFQLSSLAFKDVLNWIFSFLLRQDGLSLFEMNFIQIQKEWSELCCEICRQRLADINYNTVQNRTDVLAIIDHELSCELFQFNRAEESYLKFMIAAMKNDVLRTETKLEFNHQILNVFRNENVPYIDDVVTFIKISLEKYPNHFYNDDAVLNFVTNIKVDELLKVKLDIVSFFIEKRNNNIAPISSSLFGYLADLSGQSDSLDAALNQELSEIVDNLSEMFS